jgi:hypothetical protein
VHCVSGVRKGNLVQRLESTILGWKNREPSFPRSTGPRQLAEWSQPWMGSPQLHVYHRIRALGSVQALLSWAALCKYV